MKKQKTEMKKRMQMQIEVKKENIEESDEGKPSKKMNLCTWSLEIKIEALWDKNRSFRRNNKRALKKQKTKIKKHIQMQRRLLIVRRNRLNFLRRLYQNRRKKACHITRILRRLSR